MLGLTNEIASLFTVDSNFVQIRVAYPKSTVDTTRKSVARFRKHKWMSKGHGIFPKSTYATLLLNYENILFEEAVAEDKAQLADFINMPVSDEAYGRVLAGASITFLSSSNPWVALSAPIFDKKSSYANDRRDFLTGLVLCDYPDVPALTQCLLNGMPLSALDGVNEIPSSWLLKLSTTNTPRILVRRDENPLRFLDSSEKEQTSAR